MMKKVAVILAGCGTKDGSEIQESVLALTALSKAGYDVQCYAPDAPQAEVVNHLNGECSDEQRNQIVEAARIARGKVKPLSGLDASSYDALLIPGGFGTAKNLFTFAFDGIDFSVEPSYRKAVESFHTGAKPIAVMCIAPLSMCAIIEGVTITLGASGELGTMAEQKYGAKVMEAKVDEVVVDSTNKVFTVPCYMYDDATIAQIASAAENLVAEFSKFLQ